MDAFGQTFGVWTASAMVACYMAYFVLLFVNPGLVRRHWPFFVVAFLVSLWAVPKPQVTFPDGIRNDGSCFDTNDWQWVEFRWKMSGYPVDAPVMIDAAWVGSTNWFRVAEGLVGDYTNRISASVLSGNPTNFIYRMTSDYTPAVVEIRDFAAFALETNMAVVCSWTCPTNMVGLVGRIQYRKITETNDTWHVAKTLVMLRHNEVTVTGNFVGGRIDREFRVVVEGYEPLSLRNRTDVQVDLWILRRCLIEEGVRKILTMPLRLGLRRMGEVYL